MNGCSMPRKLTHHTMWELAGHRFVYLVQWPEHTGLATCLNFGERYGVIAITRKGLPEPPTILSGAAITRAPVGGS